MSKIEWTDRSDWNPVRGCTRVSGGCRNCYAERMAARFSDWGEPFMGFAQRTNSGPRWTGSVELIEAKLTEPLRWRRWAEKFRRRRRQPRVFVNSMSDLFHEALPDEAIDRVFAVMALCPEITFQVLTKRPKRMREWFGPGRRTEVRERLQILAFDLDSRPDYPPLPPHCGWSGPIDNRFIAIDPEPVWPLPNVWLGVSVEDQTTADERIPELLRTPAAVRFLSYEPALGPVDLGHLPSVSGIGRYLDSLSNASCSGADVDSRLDWAICGGESGPGARPAHPEWFRAVRDQCSTAGVPFFFKQWGEWSPDGVYLKERTALVDGSDGWWSMLPLHGPDVARLSKDSARCMIRVGKKAAGRLLDGREHGEFPTGGARGRSADRSFRCFE